MNHKDISRRMPDYLEGDLRLAERALFDAHVSGCDACGRELNELRQTISLLRSLPDPEPPSDLADNVMRRIRQGEGRPSLVSRAAALFGTWLAPGMALPATALAAGIALYLVDGRIEIPGFAVSHEAVGIALEQAEPPRLQVRLHAPQRTMVDRGFVDAQPRLPQQPSPVAIDFRDQPRGASAPPELTGPVLVRLPSSSPGFSESMPPSFADGAAAAQEHKRRLRNQRLTVLLTSPAIFAHDYNKLSAGEQEIWLRVIAERAVESQRDALALQALRESDDPLAQELASVFDAALGQARAKVVIAEGAAVKAVPGPAR